MPPGRDQPRERGERGARVGRVVQDARADRPRRTRRARSPGLRRSVSTKRTPRTPEPLRRGLRQAPATRGSGRRPPRCGRRAARKRLIWPVPQPISSNARVAGDGRVEQPREGAALGAGAQPEQAVARRIPGEGSLRVELAHRSRCAHPTAGAGREFLPALRTAQQHAAQTEREQHRLRSAGQASRRERQRLRRWHR